MKKNYFIIFIGIVFIQCTTSSPQKENNKSKISMDFGNPEIYNSSQIITDYSFIQLETTERSLIGEISQIEIWDDNIYILDTYTTRSLFIFSSNGKFKHRIEGSGNGPGEFISPHSFFIDKESNSLFILDRQMNRLLKYEMQNYGFIEDIILPVSAPISFAKIPNSDLFAYYTTLYSAQDNENKQLIIADKKANIKYKLFDAPISARVLHGNPHNFYTIADDLYFYSYFCNQIYKLDIDSLNNKYSLSWGSLKFPENDIFDNDKDSGEIMQDLITGSKDFIRLIYVYETESDLIVKYYVKKDFYIGVFDKKKNIGLNFKYTDINDDLGLGGTFPLPSGTFNNQFIGILNSFDLDKREIDNLQLKSLLEEDDTKEANPILVLFSVKI